MRVSDFHFDLPQELIAQHPPAVRGASRMLVLDRATGELADDLFQSLPQRLQPGDLLVLNDSRVLPARLYGTRAGRTTQANSPRPTGVIEVLLIQQDSPADAVGNVWRALVKPARKVLPGETLHFVASGAEGSAPVLSAEVVAAGEFGERTLRFAPVQDFYGAVERIGHMPLPPYIQRDQFAEADTEEDRERYQTVYSQRPGSQPPGSAAAPTAGLHFTPQMLAALAARGVEVQTLTLHVGLGTFQPVRVERLDEIRLHAERYTLPPATADALNRALAERRRIVAVGTTTTRTLEHIAQQAATADPAAGDSATWVPQVAPHSGSTSIFLAPGHRFRIVSGLLTNFHLPGSTLLMLVSAFAAPAASPDAGRKTSPDAGRQASPDVGRKTVLAAYAHAVRHGYRFYSYGDCMLLL